MLPVEMMTLALTTYPLTNIFWCLIFLITPEMAFTILSSTSGRQKNVGSTYEDDHAVQKVAFK